MTRPRLRAGIQALAPLHAGPSRRRRVSLSLFILSLFPSLKLRIDILNQMTTHNAILSAERAADWATKLDELTTKFEQLSDSIAAITRASAAPAPEPRTNIMRI